MSRWRQALAIAAVIGLVLVLASGSGGCRSDSNDTGAPTDGSSEPGTEAGGSTGGTGDGSGSSGGSEGTAGGGLDLSQPGSGLPVTLPSGVLAFGLYRWPPSSADETMTLATMDLDGQNLTQCCVLSPYERMLLLSPDGTKLATFNGGEYNYDSDLTFWVYDLAAGTLTKLPRPADDAYPGYLATYCWSSNSKALIYTCSLIGVDDGDRLARVPVDGSAGGFVEGLEMQAFQGQMMAAAGDRDAVVYTDDDSIDGFSLHVYDFGTGQSRTVLDSGVNSLLGVSPDGRYAAFLGFLGYGAENPILPTIADLGSGKLTRLPAYTSPYMVLGFVWSPSGDRVALVWANEENYPERIGVTVYDASGAVKCQTQPIDVWEVSCTTPVVWSPDGTTLYVAGGGETERVNSGAKTIYRVDASSGEASAIFTGGEGEGIIGLMITP